MIFHVMRIALRRAAAFAWVRILESVVAHIGLRRAGRWIVIVAIRAAPAVLRCEIARGY
jgi:hypothetical protein